jgi:hypothetical protein
LDEEVNDVVGKVGENILQEKIETAIAELNKKNGIWLPPNPIVNPFKPPGPKPLMPPPITWGTWRTK